MALLQTVGFPPSKNIWYTTQSHQNFKSSHSIIISFHNLFHLQFILFFNWVEYKPASYGHYVYPFWADAVGWIIGLLPVSIIFLTATQQTLQAPKNLTFMEKVRTLLRPTAEWGPAGRPCCIIPSNSKQQHESNRYDSVATSRILTNGVPSDSPTHGGGGNAYGVCSGYHDEALQL